MYWYKFRVKWWDGDTPYMCYGITYGVTYAEAISHIAKDYGENSIEELEIISMDSGETCPISRGLFRVIDEEEVPIYPINEEVKEDGEREDV